MINGEWYFGWSEDKSRPKVWDKISRFCRTQVDVVCGKLSRESKFIFSTTWEALSCRGLEIRSCLPYIIWIHIRLISSFSLCAFPTKWVKLIVTFMYSRYSCNFFCGDIKTVALKSFLYRNWQCGLFIFVSLWLQQELFFCI